MEKIMNTLKEQLDGLADGTILNDEMKSFINTYLSDRFEANIVLDSFEIDNISNDLHNTLDYITPKNFYNLLRRHETYFDFITPEMIEDVRLNMDTLDDNKINNILTIDQYLLILNNERSNRSKFIDLVDPQVLQDLVKQKIHEISNKESVTEAEAISIIDKYFDDHYLNPSEIVDKTSSRDIALQVFNDNLKNVTSNSMIEKKIIESLDNLSGDQLTKEAVSDIVLENIKFLPKNALNLEEILALINNTVGKVINNTINTKTLINYVLRQLEIKKWICEITNPHEVNKCPDSKEQENIIHIRAPFKIQESEDIVYTAISNRTYSEDALIHLSNGVIITLPEGEKIAQAICGPDVYNKEDDPYKNEEVYIVNIDKIEGVVGFEQYDTDISSVAMTIIEDMPTVTEVHLELPENIFTYMPFDYKVSVSNAPETDLQVMVKFGKNYKTLIIPAGEFEVSDEFVIEEDGMFFSGITDTIGGNYEKIVHEEVFQSIAFPPGKHVMFSIDAPKQVKEGDTFIIKIKVNKPTLLGETNIKANMNGKLMDFTIPVGETEVSYSVTLENNIWKD